MGAIGFRGLALASVIASAVACNDARVVALSPVPLGAQTMSLGVKHSLFVIDDVLYAAGANESGQLAGASEPLATLAPLDSSRIWTHVAAGAEFSCALDVSGVVYCVGANDRGQLGVGTITPPGSPPNPSDRELNPVVLPAAAVLIRAGDRHVVAILGDGTLWGWGANDEGQLAASDPENAVSPVQLGSDADWVDASAGGGHTCAIRASGALFCVGRNARGQLGVGTTTSTAVLTRVLTRIGSDDGWRMVAAAADATCALQGERLWCWGDNREGQLGLADTVDRSDPSLVSGGPWGFVARGGNATCALTTEGRMWCFGSNAERQLGTDGPREPVSSPTETFTERRWVGVWIGGFHTCGLSTDAEVFCAGRNDRAQLGFPDLIPRNLPFEVLRPRGT